MSDFVTFEITKKLKEKGCPLLKVRKQNGDPFIYDLPEEHPDWQNCDAWYIPTIWQVLKWLREEKKISVEKNVGMHPYKKDVCWYCTIVRFSESGVREILDNFGETCNVFDSYEDAAISGIEYVLNELIEQNN